MMMQKIWHRDCLFRNLKWVYSVALLQECLFNTRWIHSRNHTHYFVGSRHVQYPDEVACLTSLHRNTFSILYPMINFLLHAHWNHLLSVYCVKEDEGSSIILQARVIVPCFKKLKDFFYLGFCSCHISTSYLWLISDQWKHTMKDSGPCRRQGSSYIYRLYEMIRVPHEHLFIFSFAICWTHTKYVQGIVLIIGFMRVLAMLDPPTCQGISLIRSPN